MCAMKALAPEEVPEMELCTFALLGTYVLLVMQIVDSRRRR